MKLVSVTLCDVRRFTRPVTLAGIGPGLNVLAAPNEDGKSTLFDALQARRSRRCARMRGVRPPCRWSLTPIRAGCG